MVLLISNWGYYIFTFGCKFISGWKMCIQSTTHASCIWTEINIFLFLYHPYIIQNMHCNMFNQTPFWRFPRWIKYHHNLPKCNFTTVYVQKAEKEFYNIARIFAYYKITKIVRAFWLVKTLWFIVPVKLFYKSNRPHFLWVYKVWSIA